MHRPNGPFVPPEEDRKQTVLACGVPCDLFDTCCKSFSQEDQAETDRGVLSIYYEALGGDMTAQCREGILFTPAPSEN